MKIIAHRGNTEGPSSFENHPTQIEKALNLGFDVEVDVRVVSDRIFLGHDNSLHAVDLKFFQEFKERLWIHCKNLDSLLFFLKTGDLNCFWHQNDDFAITRSGHIWTYPEGKLSNISIDVMPENLKKSVSKNPYGICTDFPKDLLEVMNKKHHLENTRLVVFDMDGVLIDACDWHRDALNKALKTVCNYEISPEDHYRDYNGLPTKVKLKLLSEKNLIDSKKVSEVELEKQRITLEIIENCAFPKQEKIELMEFLKKRGIKVACYTNSIRKTAELMLKKSGLFDYLDLLVTNQDVTNPKPDPEGYNSCMKILGISKENCTIVEDSEKGFEAAIKSGATAIRVKSIDEVCKSLFTA